MLSMGFTDLKCVSYRISLSLGELISVYNCSTSAGISPTGMSRILSASIYRIISSTVEFLYSGTTSFNTGAMISLFQNKRMNEYNGISATKIVQIYKHTFFKILLTG